MLYEQATHIAFRQTYPLARLMATLVNVNGGYSTKKSESKVRDSITADWQDFIPPYARYAPLIELYEGADPLKEVDPEALKELWTRREELPSVLYMAVAWDGIKARVGA